ncbi:MAG: M48 family metallopeptidase [Thermodesulfobacteriota bacterium]|nr:M48 family metallopeptidase [Thermodesulfobacteriota bacterium]
MKRKLSLLLCLLFFLVSCATVPVTGRRQLSLISTNEINSMSFKAYDDFLSKNKVITDTRQAQTVKSVGLKIQKAVEQYFAEQNMSEHLKEYDWEFNLVDDSTVNAWCMPGGKVVVYTGILPITKDETGLAVVMGHEIAHALANHGKERMSQGLIVQFGGIALSQALKNKPQQTQNLFLGAYGLGSQVGVLLPYSRLHESEADHLGLIFMAMAGYDPHEAVDFWKRMASLKSGKSPPEFLSTHPSDEARINNLKKLLPEALKYYRRN